MEIGVRTEWNFEKHFSTRVMFLVSYLVTLILILIPAKFYDVIGRNVVAPRRSIRWCVITDTAHHKCQHLKHAAFSRDIRPEFDCVRESSIEKCLQTIRDGGADIITVDAVDAITAVE